MSVPAYSKIYAVGHPATDMLFSPSAPVPVQVEEKLDGSQISFSVDDAGALMIRSRSVQMVIGDHDSMFDLAVQTIQQLHEDGKLKPGYIYRGEAICKPRHNTLAYSRIPTGGIMIYDIETAPYRFMSAGDRAAECKELGLECVRVYAVYDDATDVQLTELLKNESELGGCNVEGVVIKPMAYNLFGTDGKILMAKYVSEAFKEKHSKQWKKDNPGKGDIIHHIGSQFRTEAAWEKAVQRRRDRGELLQDPKDIGPMIKDMKQDIQEEWKEDIARQLLKWAMPDILRKASAGFPEWYKRKLADRVLGEQTEVQSDD